MSGSADAPERGRHLPVVDGYAIDLRLGQGGMGTVYRARPAGAQHCVALKMLTLMDGAGIYRLKREFRIVSDIVHPNLVKLYDLHCSEEQCFFTMELVEGLPLLEHLRAQRTSGVKPRPTEREPATGPASGSRSATMQSAAWMGLDVEAILNAFRQLAEAVQVIHGAGMLHCDIKPSNVLVEHTGRVVLLDFGVSVGFGQHAQTPTIDGEIAGTPEYMAPEQAAGAPMSAASDWYAFGVVLYEALCGQLPFVGMPFGVMRKKQVEVPPRPSTLNNGVPPDLDDLCMALLATTPEQRPRGDEIIARLERRSELPIGPQPAIGPQRSEEGSESLFVGRSHELAALRAAAAAVGPSRPVVALVSGASGIGKSALVNEFLHEAAAKPDTIVLRGRCFERESVPYKAVDPIVDEISRFLRRLSDVEAAALLPRDVGALTRVFPVLKRVRAVAKTSTRLAISNDLVELRRRATLAFKEFLVRLSDVRDIILCADDVQWGDVDSARLLRSVLEPPDAPSLFVILSTRPETDSALLKELFREAGGDGFACEVRKIDLRELDQTEATALACEFLRTESLPLAPAVAREARGNPFFVRALSLYANGHASWTPSTEGQSERASVRLEPMLREHVTALPGPHRRALDLVVVASRPVPEQVLGEALGESVGASRHLWHDLREAHLVRLIGRGETWDVECYHDRVRESALALLSPQQTAECHRILASAFQTLQGVDPEILLEHFRGAGDLETAREHALKAAATARDALAFSRAARLYALALELLPEPESRSLNLWRELAAALAHDGRLEEAARAYEKAADQAEGLEAIELRRLAAQHFLTSGCQAAGLSVLRRVFGDVGLAYPEKPGLALVRLAWERARLRASGLRFRERSRAPELEKVRADVCFSGAVGLAMTDLLRTAAFSAQHLNLALQLGDPSRIARGIAFEMGVAPGAGEEGLRWATRALPVIERLTEHGTAYHRGLFFLAQGHVAYLSGQWRAAVEWLIRAEELLQDLPTGDLHWALQSGRVLASIGAVAAGDLAAAAQRLPALFDEARRRGEIHRMALMAYPAVLLELARDRPEAAANLMREISRREPASSFDLRDFTTLHCALLIDRYTGHDDDTWRRISDSWVPMERSKLLVVNIVRIAALAERGSAAAARVAGADASTFRRIAERCARDLERERLPHARALAGLVRARLAASLGDREQALATLTETSSRLDSAGLFAHGDCARRVCGSLMGGRTAELLVVEADRRLCAQGVRDPARFAAMMVPGLDVLRRSSMSARGSHR